MVTLRLIEGDFAICRLTPDTAVPAWVGGAFSSVTRTPDELSILCEASRVPADVKRESGWRLFQFCGPFDFGQTGILSSVLAPLAEAKISILATATYDTDYLMIKTADFECAMDILLQSGHSLLST